MGKLSRNLYLWNEFLIKKLQNVNSLETTTLAPSHCLLTTNQLVQAVPCHTIPIDPIRRSRPSSSCILSRHREAATLWFINCLKLQFRWLRRVVSPSRGKLLYQVKGELRFGFVSFIGCDLNRDRGCRKTLVSNYNTTRSIDLQQLWQQLDRSVLPSLWCMFSLQTSHQA